MDGDFHLGQWVVHPSLNTVSNNGTSVRLEPKVMQVLVCLSRCGGETLSKEDILQAVWPDTFVSEDVLIRSISELRRCFKDDAREPRFIETIPKRGYRLVAPVTPLRLNVSNQAGAVLDKQQPSEQNRILAWFSVAAVVLLCGVVLGFNLGAVRDRIFRRRPPIRSLAVLPLKDLSDDPSQKYFTSGMTEELITNLSQISALRVISRTSSEVYENTHKTLPEIARELNVDGIVEGSVEHSGTRVRVTAQLIYAPEDKNLWACSYDGSLQDSLTLQGTLANAIANEIRVQVHPSEQARLSALKTVNPNALDDYLQGKYHLHRLGRGFGDEEARRAAQYFQKAIDQDPSFTPAYIGLADAHGSMLRPTPVDYQIRKAAAEKAAQLDSSSAEVHELLATLATDNFEWVRAEQELRQAVELNSNRADAYDHLGYFLIGLGRSDEGVAELKLAQQLDPNNDHLINAFFHVRDYAESIKLAERDLERDPDDGGAHFGLYQSYALTGRYREAISQLEETVKLYGFADSAPALERAFQAGGFRSAVRMWARQLEQLHKDGRLYMPGLLAEQYSLLGDKDRAFYWLEDAYRNKYSLGADGGLCWLKGDPFYTPLRSDPRYADLVRRVGLPQ